MLKKICNRRHHTESTPQTVVLAVYTVVRSSQVRRVRTRISIPDANNYFRSLYPQPSTLDPPLILPLPPGGRHDTSSRALHQGPLHGRRERPVRSVPVRQSLVEIPRHRAIPRAPVRGGAERPPMRYDDAYCLLFAVRRGT